MIVETTFVGSSVVVMGVMEIVRDWSMVRGFMVGIVVNISMDVDVGVVVDWMLIVVLSRVLNMSDMSWVVSVVVVLVSGLFVLHVVDLMWEIMVVMSVVIVFMVNDSAINDFTAMVLMPIVVLVLDQVVFWLVVGVVLMWNVVEVPVMINVVIVMVLSMMVIVVIIMVCVSMDIMVGSFVMRSLVVGY